MIKSYSEYQLALLVLKVQCSFTIESKKPEEDVHLFGTLPGFAQVMLTTLDQHLDRMVKMAKMENGVAMFKDLLYKDYERIYGCVYKMLSYDACMMNSTSGTN